MTKTKKVLDHKDLLNTVELSKERRQEIIEIMERVAHRPHNMFESTLGSEWQKVYGFDMLDCEKNRIEEEKKPRPDEDDYSLYDDFSGGEYEDRTDLLGGLSTVLSGSGGYENVEYPLPKDMLEAITEIYESTDKELQDWCLLIVLCSMKFFIIKQLSRYTSQRSEQPVFISGALQMIMEDLPNYDYSKGAVAMTTFFGERLSKQYGNDRMMLNSNESSRHYAEAYRYIQKAKQALAEEGNDDPSPLQISIYCELKLDHPLSEKTIDTCLKQHKSFSSFDDAVKYTAESGSPYADPESLLLQKERTEEFYKWLDNQDPATKEMFIFRLRYIDNNNGAQPPKTVLMEHMQEMFPDISPTNIDRIRSMKERELQEKFSPNQRIGERSYEVNGFSATEGILTEEANVTVEALADLSDEEFDYIFSADDIAI